MMYAFIRFWATLFLRSYFRKTLIYGREKVPKKGPLILASNHPSAFMEASILSTVMQRPIHFLVRGDMFHPRFHWLFEWTKQIPIYRKKDGIANLRKNAASFDLTYRKLGNGESVLIFPEAKTVLEKKMRPIQKGTAHLAFGAMPFIRDGEFLFIQPVGVNFMEPRQPGTDVVVIFGEPFTSPNASREDREALEEFTQRLSDAMDPLIIQVNDGLEKNYDLGGSIYFRMIYDNDRSRNAHFDLQKVAATINDTHAINIVREQTANVIELLNSHKLIKGIYFPELFVFAKIGIAMLALLKTIWIIAGGWIWLLVRGIIFKKIRTETFQGPTAVGVFMVVFPLFVLLVLLIFILSGLSLLLFLQWFFLILMGEFIRQPIDVIWKILTLPGDKKNQLKKIILDLREELETVIKTD